MSSAIVVFFHVAAAIGLFVALTIEWLYVRALRRAKTIEQARDALTLERLLVVVGMPSVLVALASGVYLATTSNLWSLGWVKVAVPALVLVAIAGGAVAPQRKRIRALVTTGEGALPPNVKWLVRSLRMRGAVLAALVFGMTAKLPSPDDGVVFAAIIGVGALYAITSPG